MKKARLIIVALSVVFFSLTYTAPLLAQRVDTGTPSYERPVVEESTFSKPENKDQNDDPDIRKHFFEIKIDISILFILTGGYLFLRKDKYKK